MEGTRTGEINGYEVVKDEFRRDFGTGYRHKPNKIWLGED